MVILLIQNMQKIAVKIYDQVQLAKANRQQCERLVVRIQIVITAVNGLENHSNPNQFKDSLEALQACLNDCLQFVLKFSAQSGWFKEVIKAGSHEKEFAALNQKLGDIVALLNLGVDTQHFLMNSDDAKALQEDLRHIEEKQDEILALQKVANQGIEGILLKQDEQFKLLQEQMMSLRGHLKNLISMRQTPANASISSNSVLLASLSLHNEPAKKAEFIFSQAKKAEESGKHQTAFNLYLEATKLGDVKAEANVGAYLLQGIGGIPIDKKLAHHHLLNAANKGEPRAQYNLARMYEKGDGIESDQTQADYWYKQAANQTMDIKTAEKARGKLQNIEMPKHGNTK